MPKPRKQNAKAIKARLEDMRTELLRLEAASEDGRKPVVLDQTTVGRLSRMDAMQAQAMALETGRRRKAELGRIEAALTRVADGDYGLCVNCGEEIGAKRLELDPTIPICIDCAE